MVKKKNKFIPRKYVKGCKGAIALFLAVLMTPFLTLALVLVEAGRYNSAVSILDEAMGVSSTSLLANYDKYLQDRWGLLSVDQGVAINNLYEQYLTTNSAVLGDSLELKRVKASGLYALSDSEILYNQILEFSKLNAPTKLATNFLNLTDLIKSLEKFKDLGNIFDLITSGTDAIDSTITLVESADDLKQYANNLDGLKSTYETKYADFVASVDALIEELKKPRADEETDEEYNQRIGILQTSVDSAKNEYKGVVQDIIDNLSDYKKEMKDCSDALTSIQGDIASAIASAAAIKVDLDSKSKDLKALDEEIERMESEGMNESNTAYSHALDYRAALQAEVAKLQMEKGIADAAKNGLTTVNDGWKKSFNSYSDATIGSLISSFESIKTKLESFNSSSITKDSEGIKDSEYHNVSIGGYISAADIDAYLAEQENELANGSLSALINGINSFFNSILKLNLFYDPALSAYIDVQYYMDTFGNLPGADNADGGVMSIVGDIGDMLTAISDFQSNLAGLKFISALKNIKTLIESIGNLLKDIAQFAVDIVKNIIDLFSDYDRLYYSTYTTFNLPCRTDYKNGAMAFTAMTGYLLNSTSLPSQEIMSSSYSVFDDLAALVNTIKSAAAGTGDDITFSGAELEYVLYGSNSEVSNQLYTFCALYLMRLLMDIPAVLANSEVQSLATASTFGYPVVMALIIFAEPFVDTILLVNGVDGIPLYETTIYLTPTGLPKLIEKLISVCKLTTEQSESIKSGFVSAFGATDDDYDYQKTLNDYQNGSSTKKDSKFLSFNYREYCFMLLLLTVTKEQQMARLSNLIQMETLYYYQTQGVPYTFNLKNSFTYVKSEADISVKQMLPSLADSALFDIKRTQYRGY